jgi:carbonic anhydrase
MSCTEESDTYWNYDNPSEWSKHFPCANGSCQSPININTIDTIPEFYSPFLFSPKYNSDEMFTLSNNGQQITATLAKSTNEKNKNDLWFTGSGLNGTFHFVNFHLHWGRNDRHGSEHEINGHRFPAEAHFVHKNFETGQIAVLAFFFIVADDDSNNIHNEWEKYADVASQLTKVHDTKTCIFNLNQLMQVDDREFFRYIGSLTTPPCTEGVIWTIFSHEILIKEESLNLLRQNLMRKVYRPVQLINGRTIFRNYQYSKMI